MSKEFVNSGPETGELTPEDVDDPMTLYRTETKLQTNNPGVDLSQDPATDLLRGKLRRTAERVIANLVKKPGHSVQKRR